ncbi:MAG: hypothetical protein ACREDX_03050 [Aestuariivirga sp.]
MRAAFRNWLSVLVALTMLMTHVPAAMAGMAVIESHGAAVTAMDMGGCSNCTKQAPAASQCQAGFCQAPGILAEAILPAPRSMSIRFEAAEQRLSGRRTKPPTSPA